MEYVTVIALTWSPHDSWAARLTLENCIYVETAFGTNFVVSVCLIKWKCVLCSMNWPGSKSVFSVQCVWVCVAWIKVFDQNSAIVCNEIDRRRSDMQPCVNFKLRWSDRHRVRVWGAHTFHNLIQKNGFGHFHRWPDGWNNMKQICVFPSTILFYLHFILYKIHFNFDFMAFFLHSVSQWRLHLSCT